MAFNQKYLEQLRRLSQCKDKPKTVSPQQMARIEGAIKQQRIEYQKEAWRASAQWLEENCEEYRQPGNGEVSIATNGTGSSSNCPNSEPASEATVGPQPLVGAPESPQDVPATLQAPLLESAFWQKVLHGSPDALLSPGDANTALRLVARELPIGNANVSGEFSGTVRAGALRKALSECFGAAAWPAMNKLWRSAPLSPGGVAANEDLSHCSPECGTVRVPCRPGAGSSTRRSVRSSGYWKRWVAGAAN
jgi:hypothetical protein